MCRALVVACFAPDGESLAALKRAAVGTEWELTPGATSADEVLAQIEDRVAHVLVVVPPCDELISRARERRPSLQVVAVGSEPGADREVASLDEVRDAIRGLPSPGGPVRS